MVYNGVSDAEKQGDEPCTNSIARDVTARSGGDDACKKYVDVTPWLETDEIKQAQQRLPPAIQYWSAEHRCCPRRQLATHAGPWLPYAGPYAGSRLRH